MNNSPALTAAAILGLSAAGAFTGFQFGKTAGRGEYAAEHIPFTLPTLRKQQGEIVTDAIVSLDRESCYLATATNSTSQTPRFGVLVFSLQNSTDPDMKPLRSEQKVELITDREWENLIERYGKIFPSGGRHVILWGRYWRDSSTSSTFPPEEASAFVPGEGFKMQKYQPVEKIKPKNAL